MKTLQIEWRAERRAASGPVRLPSGEWAMVASREGQP
jgi:hypothetical protein